MVKKVQQQAAVVPVAEPAKPESTKKAAKVEQKPKSVQKSHEEPDIEMEITENEGDSMTVQQKKENAKKMMTRRHPSK